MGSFHNTEAPGNQAAPKTRGRQVPKPLTSPVKKGEAGGVDGTPSGLSRSGVHSSLPTGVGPCL